MKVVFTLADGRSGTSFLAGLFAANVKNCVALHEPKPYFNGPAIDWYDNGQADKIEEQFGQTRQRIEAAASAGVPVYLESSHLFLKSYCDVAMRHYPDMKLIYLIRNPLEVAKSHINRMPVCGTVSADSPWTVNPDLPIFQGLGLTEYQKFLVQWFEIQNRAVRFLDKYDKWADCCVLEAPWQLNDAAKVRQMFGEMDIETIAKEPVIIGSRNANPDRSDCGLAEEEELTDVVRQLAPRYLDVFDSKPFAEMQGHWSNAKRDIQP